MKAQNKSKLSQYELCLLYQNEWKVMVETQMHFNDLIIKFRTAILTAFLALAGAVITITKIGNITEVKLILVLGSLPLVLWLMSFILDFVYYRNLLLGSVKYAEKFDKNEEFKPYNLFGMTDCISKKISENTYTRAILIYYLLPFIHTAVIIFIYKDLFFK